MAMTSHIWVTLPLQLLLYSPRCLLSQMSAQEKYCGLPRHWGVHLRPCSCPTEWGPRHCLLVVHSGKPPATSTVLSTLVAFFFALCCLGKIPGGAPFSQLHKSGNGSRVDRP